MDAKKKLEKQVEKARHAVAETRGALNLAADEFGKAVAACAKLEEQLETEEALDLIRNRGAKG